MVAYHNDPKIKAKYIQRVEAHRKADQLMQGYGCGGGCGVGGGGYGGVGGGKPRGQASRASERG